MGRHISESESDCDQQVNFIVDRHCDEAKPIWCYAVCSAVTCLAVACLYSLPLSSPPQNISACY